ncbi:hypothetical protein G3572_14355 [Rhodobacter sp. ETT8]|uniref:Uncharacterized protein n=1 Tax=Pseudotabrizicola algicola TaxID=2709381 RepID=A0A6B3RW86_9RHOB|nr:hypothetical protein [Pseudotabrizicola algicola]
MIESGESPYFSGTDPDLADAFHDFSKESMMRITWLFVCGFILCLSQPALSQSTKAMTAEQMAAMTSNGVTLTLGGPGMGYKGSLELTKDGKGKGSAVTDAGQKISISGTWRLNGNMFCRTWRDLDGGKEVCETWHPISSRSVEVYNGKSKLGVNSW